MSIKGGYYIKARKIQESKISKMPPYVREIWDWLLKEANHKDCKYNGFEVKRGQLFRTYLDIREGLCWYVGWRKMMYHENHTKKAMKALREALMITTTKALGGVLITVVKYDYYQDPKNYERTTEKPMKELGKTKRKNHPLPYNNKNVKNVKNDKNENRIVPINYLLNIPIEDIVEFKSKYDVNSNDIKLKADEMYNYCLSINKKYTNHKAVLRKALARDFGLK